MFHLLEFKNKIYSINLDTIEAISVADCNITIYYQNFNIIIPYVKKDFDEIKIIIQDLTTKINNYRNQIIFTE